MTSPNAPVPPVDRGSYSPALVHRELARAPGTEPPMAGVHRAAVLFADISGFTPLCEHLARRGPAGIEDLSELLDRWFGGLVKLASEHGGDVLKFAGDALLAAWIVGPGEDPAATCRRAAACGLAIAQGLGRGQTADGITLSLKLALGLGELHWMLLGDVAGQRELFVAGSSLRQVERAQRAASAGELVLAPEAWEAVADGASGQALAGGCVRLSAVGAPAGLPFAALPPQPPGWRDHEAFVPAAVRARLDAGQAAWLAELRQVSVVFVLLPELDERTDPAEAQAVVAALLSLCREHEATLNKLSVDDKGASALVVSGLPPMAHRDDPRRAVELAQAISTALSALGCQHSVGVSSGRVFCGTIGSNERREYTVLGDTVNVAARLMVAAGTHPDTGPLPVLIDEATARAASGRARGLGLRPLAAVRLKGKRQPVVVHGLGDAASSEPTPLAVPAVPLVGRLPERAVLEDALEALQSGRQGAVLIVGEAGIGKTRLLEHLRSRVAARGFRMLQAAGDAADRKRSYGAWRPVAEELLSALGPGLSSDGPALRRALQAGDPELATLAPLLGAFLPLDLPDNDVTAGLAGEMRAGHTRRAFLGLLREAVGDGPLVLLVEDAQWMDSASWGLLARLWSERARLLLVVCSRPIAEPQPADLCSLRADPLCTELRLAPLSEADSLTLAARCLGVEALPPALARLVAQRAEGHPFFSEELVWAARDAGLIRVVDGRCELAVDPDSMGRLSLPDTLQGAITARIDRLQPQQQLAMKVASVIGRIFALAVLDGAHPIASDRARLGEDLDVLCERNLTRLVQRSPEVVHAFEHALTRDVAYELMAFSQRRRLHRAVAEHLERAAPEQHAHLIPRLAHHWLRSLDEREPEAESGARTLGYLGRAGEQALQDFANEEAVGFLEDALALDTRLGGAVSPLQRARWEGWLGQACLQLGRMPASGAHLERAIAILDRPVPGPVGLVLRLVGESWSQLWVQLGFGGRAVSGDEGVLLAARAYASLFVVRYQANQALHTVHAALRGLALAARCDSLREQASGLATLCLIAGTVPLHALARRYERQALERGERCGDPGTLAWVLEVLGVYAIGVGRWDDVERGVERASAIAERIGDGRRWEEAQAVLSWLEYFRAEPSAPAERWASVAQPAQQRRDPQPRIWGLCGVVEAGWVAGSSSLEACLELLAEARELLPDDIYRAEAIRALGVAGAMAARAGHLEQAREAAMAALEATRGLMPTTFYSFEGYAGVLEVLMGLELRDPGDPVLRRARRRAWWALAGFARVFPIAGPRIALLSGLYAWSRGRRAAARRRWHRGLARARAIGLPLEELRLLDALALDGEPHDEANAAAASAATSVDRARVRAWWLDSAGILGEP